MKRNPRLAGGPISPEEVPNANQRFQEEQEKFDFRYRCGDCLHYSPEDDLCSLGFPTQHYGAGPHRCRTEKGELVFCKYFEIS